MSNFNYEKKIFGVGIVKKDLWQIPAVKLSYCLDRLKNTRGKVLEVGCGAGAMAKAIKFYRPDLQVYAIDISRTAIKSAQNNPDGVIFLLGDVYKIPFKENNFDAVVCFDVLEHLNDIPKAAKEIKRVLKKSGIFYSVTPCEGSLWGIEGWITRLGWKAKEIYCGHLNHFTYSSLEKQLLVKGFKLKNRKTSAHFLSQLVDVLYFMWLSIRKRNVSCQVEGYISSRKGFKRDIVFMLRSIFAVISNIESFLFFWYPGLNDHLELIKE